MSEPDNASTWLSAMIPSDDPKRQFNAPHFFKNISGGAARMLCMCTPPGQEEFFMAIGDPVDARTAPPPNLTEQEREQRRRKARELGPKYRTEYLKS